MRQCCNRIPSASLSWEIDSIWRKTRSNSSGTWEWQLAGPCARAMSIYWNYRISNENNTGFLFRERLRSAPERISAVSENRWRTRSRTKEHATGQRAVAHTRWLCAREKEREEEEKQRECAWVRDREREKERERRRGSEKQRRSVWRHVQSVGDLRNKCIAFVLYVDARFYCTSKTHIVVDRLTLDSRYLSFVSSNMRTPPLILKFHRREQNFSLIVSYLVKCCYNYCSNFKTTIYTVRLV